ncbi:MAG: hypothetical protein H7A25_08555 [Leptospiraceae bacterium]|nr:hypothetical protein [Leptospiraceae bacterium]MCP5499939.1 hypothetical protein [Leptospiraceae bacterium]
MNKLATYLLFICAVFFTLNISAQDDTSTGATADTSAASAGDASGSSLNKFSPLAVYDYRMEVKNVSFSKRYADNGRGEVLDVQLDLQSHDAKNNKYSIYVLALNESNAIEPVSRALVPHPAWRPNDPKKSEKRINFSELIGSKPFKQEELGKSIWDSLQPRGTGLFGKKTYDERKQEVEKRQNQGQRVKLGEPSLEEYILYLSSNPKDALEFTLYGTKGPSHEERLVSNFKGITDDENKKDIYESFPEHKYTILQARQKTTIMTHHYTEYRPDYYNFNKVLILIFDPARTENKLVYRSIHDLGDLKIRR